MAARQIRRIVADRPQGVARTDTGQRPGKIAKVFKAMLQMTKIDIEGLKRAYRGE
jgi:hypothetical protein